VLRELFQTGGLDRPGLRVLIVEDYVPLLVRLTEMMEELGHHPTSLLGVSRIENGVLYGPSMTEGVEGTAKVAEVEVAFLDHYFLSGQHNGQTITAVLRAAGNATILGMSSDASANAAMVKAGATASVRKALLMRALGMS
jgi:hypothetical protein